MPNFMKIPLVGGDLIREYGQTDMERPTVAFRNFRIAPKTRRRILHVAHDVLSHIRTYGSSFVIKLTNFSLREIQFNTVTGHGLWFMEMKHVSVLYI